MKNTIIVMICLCHALAFDAWAVNELKPAYIDEALTSHEVHIDGALSEAVWADAEVINRMVEVYPDDRGRDTTLDTEIKVFYNEHGLFVGFWAETPRDKQLSRLSFRDNGGVERDWFRVSIDPTGQGVNGYYMELALGGSKQDGTIVDERQRIREWDGPWLGVTRATENGWSGEMYLPWSMFALPEVRAEERSMGIHFERWVSHLSQRWAWEPLSDRDPRYLSGFSKLRIRNVESPGSLIIYPYASAAGDQLADSTKGRAGLDLFWTPTAGVRLAATALPDFGQVESDALVVNLDAVETFFPEKRPFFLEDRDIYNTRKYNLVHTRRIGTSPDLPEIAEGYSAADVDGAADIMAASKLTGQKKNFRYGAMFAIEDDAHYNLIDNETGESEKATIEGRGFYTGRLMHEKTSQGGAYRSIGWLGTFADRPSLDRDAQVHAVDYAYRSSSGKVNLSSQAMSSMVRQGQDQEDGYGAWVDVTWRPNKKWRHNGEVVYMDDKLNINDLGFLRRNDQRWISYFTRRTQTENPRFRELRSAFNVWRGENNDGRMFSSGVWSEQYIGFHNRYSIRLAGSHNPEQWDDLNSRGNGIVRKPHRTNLVVGLDSDSRQKLGFYAEYRRVDNGWESGFGTWETYTSIRYTVNQHVDFRMTVRYRDHKDWLLWREGTTFATYDAGEMVPSLRANILFSPKQDLRMILQWYAIDATANRELALDTDGNLNDVAADPSRHNFAIGSMAFQLRYRFEIAPLSDLYVVYSRGGSFFEDQSTELSDIWSGSLDNKTADNFFLKFRYRFD